MRRRVEVGRIWGRGIEWDAIRTLLASDARTEMGRERALAASPLTEATEIQAALDLTAEARRALAQEGAPPLDGIPDVRPALERAGADGAALDGAELLLFVPVLDSAPRLAAYGGAVAPLAPALAARTAKLPRIDLAVPDRAIGRDTVGAMQSGIVNGYLALTNGLLARIRRELAESQAVEPPAVRAFLTGGLSAAPWARLVDGVDVIDPDLTLKGLAILHAEVAGGEPLELGLS